MAEQWIPAAQAINLVSTPPNNLHERLALCDRANAGLIKSRARLLVVDGTKRENIIIPAKFWWAKGHEALDQEWSIGDFSTWIESSQWCAYGVSFALSGLLEMLPVERRASTARNLSIVGQSDWLSAKEARRFAYEKAGLNPQYAGAAILDACLLGYISARAVLMRRADGREPDNWNVEEREWDVPEWFWENFTAAESGTQDWERGIFAGDGRAPDARCWITLTGVYFLAETMSVLLPRDAKPKPVDTPAPNPGGRPRKPWWDDLWCSIWGRVYRGDFDPKRQADIERAMLDWASDNGHTVSESVVRPLARKMVDAMKREGENS